MYYIYYAQIELSSQFKTMGSSCMVLFAYIYLEISIYECNNDKLDIFLMMDVFAGTLFSHKYFSN